MTDTATRVELQPFEGDPVHSVGVEVRNAAGGLNEALKVDAAEWHKDDEVVVVLRCNVDKIRFEPVKDTDGWRRVHILSASEAVIIESELVEEALANQTERIARAKEAEKGVQRLPTDDELLAQHEAGDHAEELVEGCVECDRELEAEEAERAAN